MKTDASNCSSRLSRETPATSQKTMSTWISFNSENLSPSLADAGHGFRIVPFTDRDHQIPLGVSGKTINARFTIRSVLVQCLHHLLIQADDSRTSFHITPEGRQPPPRHLQGRRLAKGGP